MREFMLFVHVFSFALGALLALQAAFILPDETSQLQTVLDAATYSGGATEDQLQEANGFVCHSGQAQARAGIQLQLNTFWIPAFAGMTVNSFDP